MDALQLLPAGKNYVPLQDASENAVQKQENENNRASKQQDSRLIGSHFSRQHTSKSSVLIINLYSSQGSNTENQFRD